MYMSFYSCPDKRDMTFLYRLTPGVCSKSYGMVVAKMAGIPDAIIEKANVIAAEFEENQQWNQDGGDAHSLGRLAVFTSLFKDDRGSLACERAGLMYLK
jgi:DNA mismatch repair protein MSH6